MTYQGGVVFKDEARKRNQSGVITSLVSEPLDERLISRLEGIGLSKIEYELLVDRFVGDPKNIVISNTTTGRSYVPKGPLRQEQLIQHLEGSLVISVGARWDRESRKHRTRYITVDLDNGGTSLFRESLFQRYDAVVAVLSRPTYVWRSSLSGGLHLRYELDEEVDLYLLRADDGIGGAILALFRSADLDESAGLIEVYPRGRTKRFGQQNRLRVPFGSGSRLIEPVTLDVPLTGGPIEDLRLVAQQMLDEEITLLSIRDLLERGKQLPRGRALRKRHGGAASLAAPVVASSRPHGSNEARRDEMERLLAHGLERPGQLHNALLELAWECRRRRLRKRTSREAIRAWLDAHHNGQSRTYNHDPSDAYQELDDIVEYVFSRQPVERDPDDDRPELDLSAFECRRLFEATVSEVACCDPETGECVDRFKLQRIILWLLQHAKEYVLSEIAAVLPLGMEDLGSAVPSIDVALVASLGHVCPDPLLPEFIVPIPYALRTRLGASPHVMSALWRAAKASGLFVLECPAITLPLGGMGRCETYRVPLDFGALSSDPRTFPRLEFAAGYLLPDAELHRLYPKSRRRVILQNCRQLQALPMAELVAGMSPLDAAVMACRRLLRQSDVRSDAAQGSAILRGAA